MPHIICFANMKGGVGKTTLCVNLAFEMLQQGKKVLLVDNDPQFNATSALLAPERYIGSVLKNPKQNTIYHIYEREPRILGKAAPKQEPKSFICGTWSMTKTPEIRLDIICSQIELYETLRNPSQKEYLLDKFLTAHAQEYDYVFIDCPPTPSVLTLSAFAASDFVIIPVAPDYYATLGLPQFLGTLEEFKEELVDGHDIRVLGVIFTNAPRQETPESQKSIRRVREAARERPSEVPIFNSKMSHFQVYKKTLWQAVPVQKIGGRGTRGKSDASAELRAICNETIARIEAIRNPALKKKP